MEYWKVQGHKTDPIWLLGEESEVLQNGTVDLGPKWGDPQQEESLCSVYM